MADIWDNLNTTKLGDEPGTVINTQTRGIHLEKKNKELLSDVNLINSATFRDGSPMPETGVVTSQNQPNDTTDILIRPGVGEIWSIIGISATMTSPTGSNTQYFYMTDGSIDVYLGAAASSSTNIAMFPGDAEFKFPLVLSRDMYLKVNSNLDNANSCLWKYCYIRLR